MLVQCLYGRTEAGRSGSDSSSLVSFTAGACDAGTSGRAGELCTDIGEVGGSISVGAGDAIVGLSKTGLSKMS